jgi:4-carboxymuconolactone decarboxylase
MSDAGPVRILEIPPEQLTPAQKAGIEAVIGGRGRLLTPYKIWLHSPTLMRALETLGTFLNKACSLSEREVELCITLTAHHWHGTYVETVHAKRLKELGVPEAALRAISAGKDPDFHEPRERAIYELAKAAEAPGPGADAMFERAEKALGRNGLAEVLALFGYYSAVAIAMKLHRVPVPA